MPRSSRLLVLPIMLVLTACATPADVQANYERAAQAKHDEFRSYQQDLAELRATRDEDLAWARDWDHHVLGIPASGWVPILVFLCVGLLVLLGVTLYLISIGRADRRRKAHDLALAREKSLQQAVERGPCTNCGLDVPAMMEQIREKGKGA